MTTLKLIQDSPPEYHSKSGALIVGDPEVREDISEVQVRAKLVVLSCCHSARGQVKAEGVIGIARAFLGSGARSVLAARWALEDEATEEFMNCFYDHLFHGKSASESLHEARKWMRSNGFDKVSQWASFMLIGDNVTFDFENWPKSTTP
ncbi:Tetratricopeptide repeat protein 28 [Stylophora pistillata]|uniref:Tetratricopeptide repeat protein 28 n=1 Tax=Stylophora pistillata TaxID=50429 RepID=A0A2B4R4Y7_STYPI|nr:Tetratricopeptide repeat protein 28 [Stylophora pistillata]